MEYLNGVRLVDGIRSHYRQIAALTGRTLEEIELEKKQQIEQGTFVYKSIEETRREQDAIRWVLFLKDLTNVHNIGRFMYNYSPLGWIFGSFPYDRTKAPIDLGHTLELLAFVHANEIFEHGEGYSLSLSHSLSHTLSRCMSACPR
jgi:hypothetical protein